MTGYVDIDHWETHDGGDPIDGPILLTDEPTGDAMHWTPQEDGVNDEPTVCIAHGAFIPCRRHSEHRYTANPFWVKSVHDYQTSSIPDLTWEPAWERP